MGTHVRSDLPLIGLTTYREHAVWGVWSQRADVLHVDYSDAVVRAGGLPLLLPPASAASDCDPAQTIRAADALAGRLDGLIVTGGADVDPSLYDADSHPRTGAPRHDRDAWELALLRAAQTAALPVLAVCRGMQLMVVAAGGSLHQHLPDLLGATAHDPGGDEFGRHEVATTQGTLVREIEGERVSVHCHHHQGIDRYPGFVATAHAEDGCVEAVELAPDHRRTGARFVLGVQWHPEVNRKQRLFDALVSAAAAGAGLPAGGA